MDGYWAAGPFPPMDLPYLADSLVNGSASYANAFINFASMPGRLGAPYADDVTGASMAFEMACPTPCAALGMAGVATGRAMSIFARSTAAFDAIAAENMAVKVAASRTTTVIGKVADLKNLPAGEQSLLSRLPDLGNPKANWMQNAGVLRQEMGLGRPLRDASVDSTGMLINNTGFLRAERNLLRNHGWSYDPGTTMWYPLVGP